MRQLFAKLVLVAAVVTLAACQTPQSYAPLANGGGVRAHAADSAVGHP